MEETSVREWLFVLGLAEVSLPHRDDAGQAYRGEL
jgi:hypothetical protein